MLHQGRSNRGIARALNVSVAAAQKYRKKEASPVPPPKIGRPSSVSSITKRALTRNIDIGKIRSVQEGQKYIEDTQGVHVSVETVRRYVKSEGLKNYVRPCKRKLTRD